MSLPVMFLTILHKGDQVNRSLSREKRVYLVTVLSRPISFALGGRLVASGDDLTYLHLEHLSGELAFVLVR